MRIKRVKRPRARVERFRARIKRLVRRDATARPAEPTKPPQWWCDLVKESYEKWTTENN